MRPIAHAPSVVQPFSRLFPHFKRDPGRWLYTDNRALFDDKGFPVDLN